MDTWSQHRIDQFLARLPGARRLECMLTFDAPELDISKSTDRIRTILQYNQYHCRTNMDQWNRIPINKRRPTLYNFGPLRELLIEIGHALDVSLDTLPFPPSLTSLELKISYSLETSENLYDILKRCPLLERLCMEACEMDGEIIFWIYLDQRNQPAPLPPRALTLRHVPFRQCYLENLLFSLPALKELTLMTPDWVHCPEYDWMGFVDYLRALQFTLDTLHLSQYHQPLPLEAQLQMREICPTTSDWSLYDWDITPSYMQTLALRTSFVTTLNLFWRPKNAHACQVCCTKKFLTANCRLLHELLCTSPQLIHLKSLKAPIHPQYMDIYEAQDLDIITQDLSALPPIWGCRGLETLHIEMHGQFDSRVLYGYVSRVLPQLEELYLIHPGRCGSNATPAPESLLLLEGGFCLLSRLKHLERLWLKNGQNVFSGNYSKCGRKDVSWLDASSGYRAKKNKAERRDWMRSWSRNGIPITLDQRARRERNLLPPADAKESDVEIWRQLQHLGLHQDVVNMIHEIDSKGFKALPSLKKVSLWSSCLKRPKDELNMLLPRKWYRDTYGLNVDHL